MRNTPAGASASLLRQIPREILNILGVGAAVFAVVALGSLIASVLPAEGHTASLLAACYAAPAAVAFVIYWWCDQRH
jgi:apolipoprotein N-acyltransferase